MIEVKDLAEVPEKYHGDYKQIEKDGETVWMNKAFLSVKEANEKYKGRESSLSEKATAYDKLQTQLAEKAAVDEEARIKGLHDKSDYKSLHDELKQKYEDLERRAGESKKEFDAREAAYQLDLDEKGAASLIADLGEMFTDAGKRAANKLLKQSVRFDSKTKSYTFLNDDGGVTSLDKRGFIAEIESSEIYAPLLKAKVSKGGFGSSTAGAAGGSEQKTFKSPVERLNAARSKQ